MESLLLYVLLHNVCLSSAELLVLRQGGLEDSSLVEEVRLWWRRSPDGGGGLSLAAVGAREGGR